MQILLLARLQGQRPVYGALVDDRTHPGTILGLAGPLDARSQRRFLTGAILADPDRAAWGQRQHWAFPILAMRAAPVLGNAAVAPAATPPVPPTATYRHEFVRCGKPTCSRCRTGPGHGPYAYAYWHAGGTLHKHYLGPTRPRDQDPHPPNRSPSDLDPPVMHNSG
jgi:hypothetical protein